jgi:hypothetical protein
MGRFASFDVRQANGWFRRIRLIAARSGEGLLSIFL